MDNEKGIRDYLKQKANNDIIIKYLFIKTIEGQYGDEYIRIKYRINPKTIRSLYESLDQEERMSLETQIRKQIEAGEIDLNKEAVNWHREALKDARNDEISGQNIRKKGDER